MEITHCRNLIKCFIVFLSAAAMFMGCGIKKDPKPPKALAPAGVSDLTYRRDGDQVYLEWVTGVEGSIDVGETAGFYVFRSKIPKVEPECPKCPILFDRVGEIIFDEPQLELLTIDQREYRTFDETLEKGYRYIYKVSAFSEAGLLGPESNSVELVY